MLSRLLPCRLIMAFSMPLSPAPMMPPYFRYAMPSCDAAAPLDL